MLTIVPLTKNKTDIYSRYDQKHYWCPCQRLLLIKGIHAPISKRILILRLLMADINVLFYVDGLPHRLDVRFMFGHFIGQVKICLAGNA